MQYKTQPLIKECQSGFNVNIHKAEYLYIGSDIQNMTISGNVQMKGTATFRYLQYI